MALHTANVVILNGSGEIDADLFSVDFAAETLAAGVPATVENTGTTQHQQWTIGVPQGIKGDTGDTGPAGGVPVDLPTEDVDVNTLTTIGAYYIGSTSTNLPDGASTGGILEVFTNGSKLFQIYIVDGLIAFRSGVPDGSLWVDWETPENLVSGGTFSGDIKSTTAASVWAPRKRVISQKTANYVVTANDDLVIATGSSPLTITLPAGMTAKEVTIFNITSTTVTVTGDGTSLLTVPASAVLQSDAAATYVSDNASLWYLVSTSLVPGTVAGTYAAGNDSRIVNAVPNTRKVNAKPLSADVTLAASDVGAAASIGGGKERVLAPSTTTGNVTLDCNIASVFTISPTGNISLVPSNVPATGTACTISVVVTMGATAYNVTLPGTAVVLGNLPIFTANKVTVVTMMTVDNGTTWLCSAGTQA